LSESGFAGFLDFQDGEIPPYPPFFKGGNKKGRIFNLLTSPFSKGGLRGIFREN